MLSRVFANSAGSHWLPRGHMTSKSETVSRQNLLASNIVKSITSESNGHPGCQGLFMRGFWCQAFTAVVSARDPTKHFVTNAARRKNL